MLARHIPEISPKASRAWIGEYHLANAKMFDADLRRRGRFFASAANGQLALARAYSTAKPLGDLLIETFFSPWSMIIFGRFPLLFGRRPVGLVIRALGLVVEMI
jgi:hypothetical protein